DGSRMEEAAKDGNHRPKTTFSRLWKAFPHRRVAVRLGGAADS
ncbi:MAG: hypothetical protein RLZZ622_1822, partial [Planctomycetota bacterium]